MVLTSRHLLVFESTSTLENQPVAMALKEAWMIRGRGSGSNWTKNPENLGSNPVSWLPYFVFLKSDEKEVLEPNTLGYTNCERIY